jgi:beta-glucanase (GH16 family)
MVQIPVADPQNQWHTYGINWTSAAITYFVDGAAVRTLKYEDAKGGSRFPQTPMRLRLGLWAGGDPTNGQGTVDWAGGLTDYSKAPFTMYIDSTTVTNYSPADKYHYKDNSGDWKSIEVIGGSTGGIVSPGQQNVQNAAVSSSTSGQSTGSAVGPDASVQTVQASSSFTSKSYDNSTVSTSAVSAAATKTPATSPTSASTPSGSSTSKSSATAAKATNAASGLGGMREVAGLSVLSVLSLILFG